MLLLTSNPFMNVFLNGKKNVRCYTAWWRNEWAMGQGWFLNLYCLLGVNVCRKEEKGPPPGSSVLLISWNVSHDSSYIITQVFISWCLLARKSYDSYYCIFLVFCLQSQGKPWEKITISFRVFQFQWKPEGLTRQVLWLLYKLCSIY